MKNKTNIAELLKDCPIGMELDCTMYDSVTLLNVNDREDITFPIKVLREDGNYIALTKYGQYTYADFAKCVIYPKGKTTWEGFVPPCKFKDGDIVTWKDSMGSLVACIYKERFDISFSHHIALYKGGLGIIVNGEIILTNDELRLATEEERQKLFDAIKSHGYKWNPETKTLEKLPKFKVGDKIVKKNSGCVPFVIMGVSDNYYYSNTESSVEVLPIAEQDNWELISNIEPKFKVGDRVRNKNYKDYIYNIYDIIDKGYRAKEINADSPILILFGPQEDNYELVPNKFDATTLIPFESRVLMRSSNAMKWTAAFYSHKEGEYFAGCGLYCKQCIPYEGNEHLLGKTDDCEEYYKIWE